ncbi:hypothetical protein SKAU_G00097130 [Synaphobranchus kaupii]|uniref:Uncharacterized protein n=1 Tax=Synaphobranchus kaupii TaxID=118154 RepID=A0A9Q1FYR4_SYNKA|nr:hypothetical protein SKAU_G00097130 [Synaphobranchus kaupii]
MMSAAPAAYPPVSFYLPTTPISRTPKCPTATLNPQTPKSLHSSYTGSPPWSKRNPYPYQPFSVCPGPKPKRLLQKGIPKRDNRRRAHRAKHARATTKRASQFIATLPWGKNLTHICSGGKPITASNWSASQPSNSDGETTSILNSGKSCFEAPTSTSKRFARGISTAAALGILGLTPPPDAARFRTEALAHSATRPPSESGLSPHAVGVSMSTVVRSAAPSAEDPKSPDNNPPSSFHDQTVFRPRKQQLSSVPCNLCRSQPGNSRRRSPRPKDLDKARPHRNARINHPLPRSPGAGDKT